jgi:hypothetical protein
VPCVHAARRACCSVRADEGSSFTRCDNDDDEVINAPPLEHPLSLSPLSLSLSLVLYINALRAAYEPRNFGFKNNNRHLE